jgi:DNA-binding transcriptional LysR family regulator
MLNLNQLRIFYSVAKNLSFTLAAKDLFITQPAVTAQVKSFEDYCGLKLFRRRGRAVSLTVEGKVLYDHAKKIFEYEKDIEGVIGDFRELKRGILRLGTTKVYARYFMPSLVTRFHSAYPHIRIHLDEGSSSDMIHSLLDFRNEVAIIAKAEDHLRISFTPFSREEVVLLLSHSHRLARKKSLVFAELAEEPIIMKEVGSGTRKLVDELFAGYHCTPNILMETSNTEFIKELVQRGEGISFLVKEVATTELQEKKLATVPIKEHRIFLDVNVAYLRNEHLSPPAQAFLNILGKLTTAEASLQGIASLVLQDPGSPP